MQLLPPLSLPFPVSPASTPPLACSVEASYPNGESSLPSTTCKMLNPASDYVNERGYELHLPPPPAPAPVTRTPAAVVGGTPRHKAPSGATIPDPQKL